MAAQVGIGHDRAADLTRQFIAHFSPQALVSWGFAGGLNPHLTSGTIVIATALVSPEGPQVWAEAHRELGEQFQAAAAAARLPFHRGRLVTVADVAADPIVKAALWRRCGADAVDMETAGIAQAASESNLPWVAVRVVVDSAAESVPVDCLRTVDGAGQISMTALMYAVCRSPSLLRHLWGLAVSAAVARRRLSHLLAQWARSAYVEAPLSGTRSIGR
jgi:adenosylhomocysteine nucleosidase